MSRAFGKILSSIFGNFKLDYLSHTDEKKIIAKYENFLSQSFFFLTTNFDEVGKQNRRRLVILLLLKVCSICVFARSIAYIVWPTPFVKQFTVASFHYLGDPVLINLLMALGLLSGNLGHGALHQYYNIFGHSRMFLFMKKIKNRQIEYKLNNKFKRKFYLRMNIIAIILNKVFIPCWLFLCIVFCSPSLSATLTKNLISTLQVLNKYLHQIFFTLLHALCLMFIKMHLLPKKGQLTKFL